MRVTVIKDLSGRVVATDRHLPPPEPEQGKAQLLPAVRLVPGPGQFAIEMELPTTLEEAPAERLHEALEGLPPSEEG
jgi:hypothetical protein